MVKGRVKTGLSSAMAHRTVGLNNRTRDLSTEIERAEVITLEHQIDFQIVRISRGYISRKDGLRVN